MYPLMAVNAEGPTETTAPQTEVEKLVAAAKDGDSAAFEALVMRYKRLVLAVTRRITGSIVEAEDLSQQAFMKAFANLSKFAGRCSFSTWLVTIAMNEARMWHRKARRSREVPMAELGTGETSEMPVDFMDRRPNPEATYSQEERTQHLRSAMERLNPAMREALKLCDLEEQTSIAAALLLGVTVSGVKSRRHRGRLALRRTLESRLFPEKRCARKGARDQATESATNRT
jgi:RNA polymerase sigma-70 factor (ECF subfamily)